ncbi:MAG TPA: transporter substrate-binding domain-containing protein [Acidimicrobiales bacterium]|nr:transporter substrate-binding domain-containing protein [Acidimicrobiales bacterium]
MRKTWRSLAALLLAFGLLAAACGDDSDDGGSEATSGGGGGTQTGEGGGECPDPLPLKQDGVLTVATGEPAFPPWVEGPESDETGEGDPYSGEGFESALVYAIAEQLGIEEDSVEWVRTGFDEAIAAGETDYDFNIQQFGITPQRDEVVDFSDGYYTVQQAIVGAEDGEIADATSLADLQGFQLGAAIGTTSLDYIEQVIQPDSEPLVFDDNAAAKAAFDAGQVDGIVFDLPTAYYITAVEIPNSSIVGVLPATGDAEELGMLFEEGSPLVPCVNEALAALEEDGTLAALQEEWLQAGGDIPTLEE